METIFPRGDVYAANCPTRLVLDRLADKWTVLLVAHLATSTCRFGELRRKVGGISPKVLTQSLRALERDGIVQRRVYATTPPKVEYSLTPLGRTLTDVFGAITSWSETHIDDVRDAQHRFDQRERTLEEAAA